MQNVAGDLYAGFAERYDMFDSRFGEHDPTHFDPYDKEFSDRLIAVAHR